MNKLSQLPRPVLVVIALAVIAALYFALANLNSDGSNTITASGSIEATIINVSPEISGKILTVDVNEGDQVKTNAPLLHLDPSLLTAQRAVAAANLDAAKAGAQTAQDALSTAQSQYQITLESALAQDKKTRVQDWFLKDTKQFDQPNWYFTRTEQLKSVQDQIDIALKTLNDAQAKLVNVNQSVEKADFLKAEKRLLDARLAYLMAKDVNDLAQNSTDANAPVGRYNSTHCGTNDGYKLDNKRLTNLVYRCTGDDDLSVIGSDLYDAADQELTDAQNAYDALLGTKAADEILQTRAEVSIAQERYYTALDYQRQFQTGDQSISVLAAQGVLSQAQAGANQAQKAIEQAQANLDLLDKQVSKLDVFAVMDGVILSRNIEPGEFVQPGAVALTMADLTDLTITVYVPEDHYGKISFGQTANVRVDSFPDVTFTATVIYISDQAEFTPRNVQTVEGRSATFYAIKLKVNDPNGKLKIGMPADVVFK
jgi:multidrug efflux pump subunit AcrA (membrane-fusion protein)